MEIIDTRMNTISNPLWLHTYRDLKGKFKIAYDDNMYSSMATNVLLSMFEWDDRIFRPELLDMILHDNGVAALVKTTTAEYTPVFCYIAGGERYADGLFRNVICYDFTAKKYEFTDWRENPDVLVFFNNFLMSPDNFIDKYAYMLTNVDTSLDFNVKFSRYKPIPVANNQKTKNQIDAIFNDLNNGVLKTVLADTDLRDIVAGVSKQIETVNITDVESSKYIQYLSNLHDSLISRLFFHMGLSISDNGKQAQVSVEELNKNKSASLSIVQSWYMSRKKGFEIAKQKKGIDFSFDFSELWKSELEAQTQNEFEENSVHEESIEKDGEEDA